MFRGGKERALIPAYDQPQYFGHLKFVHSDNADKGAKSGQRGGGKASWDLVIEQPVHMGRVWFYLEGNREPREGSKEGGDVIRGIFSMNLS